MVPAESSSSGIRRTPFLGVEVAVLPGDEDRGDRAVLGGLEDVVDRGAIGVHHRGLVLLVELEDVGGGVDAVARADAERAVDFYSDAVVQRELVAHRRR